MTPTMPKWVDKKVVDLQYGNFLVVIGSWRSHKHTKVGLPEMRFSHLQHTAFNIV